MDVLLVNYEYPDVTANCGGGGRVTKLLAEGLRDRGHRVRVVTDDPSGHYATFPIRHHRNIARQIKRIDPDVINGHFSLPSSVGLPRLARQHDCPLVISTMGADVYDPTRFGWLRPVTRRLNARLFAAAERTVAPSRDLANRMVTTENCQIIRYGIDPDEWAWRDRTHRSDADTHRILSVCRLVERKNLHTAIEAVAAARNAGRNLEYTIVGTGPLADELAEGYANLDWLSLPGYVEDLQATFDDHDVFFLPSAHEAFGIVFLEALAAGLPVVTSSTGGQSELFDQGTVGRNAPPQADLQAAALNSVLEEYASHQRATKGYVERHYRARYMVDEYEQLYREVAA